MLLNYGKREVMSEKGSKRTIENGDDEVKILGIF